MLSPEHRALIKATVPVLEAGGEALTTHFYKIMLSEYPEVRPLFNQAHQSSGDQPRALANSVLMYAKHIDRLEQLGPLVGQIVNKHVSLQILPEHYPIVGRCLLRAIREVVGPEVATDELIDAWAAAYDQLAALLIGAEEAAYAANEQAPGGWRGAREFRLAHREDESEEITSFYLTPTDGGALLDFTPGQYIGLRLVLDGEELRRNYSLSAPADGKHYRISVKREEGGKVSRWLHDSFGPGDRLELFPPAGDFTLSASERPLVLISAGVGITPLLPMLETAKDSGRAIHFIQYARHAGVSAFGKRLRALAAEHPHISYRVCYSEPREADQADAVGLPCREHLAEWLPEDRNADVYFLGPKPFMATLKRELRELGVPESQCRYEFFGPAAALED